MSKFLYNLKTQYLNFHFNKRTLKTNISIADINKTTLIGNLLKTFFRNLLCLIAEKYPQKRKKRKINSKTQIFPYSELNRFII